MSYLTRALQARDPRYARILQKLGYARADITAAAPTEPKVAEEGELTALRQEYEVVLGKRPYHGWDADELRAKIAAAKAD